MTVGPTGVAPVACAAGIWQRCQPPGCTKQLFGVKITWPFALAGCLRAKGSAPQILVRAPCRLVKAARSRCRQRSQFGSSSARGQPRGLIPLGPSLAIPESCRGPIQAMRSGAMTQPGARAPGGPTSFRPGGALAPGCLRSVVQLPDTPGYPLDRSMTSVLSLTVVDGWTGHSHGTSWPSRSYRSRTA